MTVTTVVFNRVQSRHSRVGLGLDPVLESYQAAQWGGFAFGIVGVFLPYVGVYCRGSLSFLLGSSYLFCHRVFQRGRRSRQREKDIRSMRTLTMIFVPPPSSPPASPAENCRKSSWVERVRHRLNTFLTNLSTEITVPRIFNQHQTNTDK